MTGWWLGQTLSSPGLELGDENLLHVEVLLWQTRLKDQHDMSVRS